MIVNVICAAIETFVQMITYISIFVNAYGGNNKRNKFTQIYIGIFAVIVYLSLMYNNVLDLFSISAVLTDFFMITALLWMIIRRELTRIIACCFFITISILIIKLPILVIIGIIYDKSLSETIIYNYPIWTRVLICVIFILLYVMYVKHKKAFIWYFKRISHQRAVLFFVGSVEYIIVFYIMNIGWYGFTIHTFILTICLIFMLFMLIVCLLIIIEYKVIARINHLLKSKENSMRQNYALINQEIERNRKINHDNKHDLEYLYNCFKQKDYNCGIDYIQKKKKHYKLIQRNYVWTGHGSIDFLINRAKAQADEKKILFTIEVDIVEIPIEEYDFFSVLSNLLDNAIEAASQNNEGEGRITLQILSLNNVFKLKIENTYLIEPDKRGKHFVSNKEDKELHGWGIENVKEVVNRYEGEIDIKYGNGIFLVDLILIQ